MAVYRNYRVPIPKEHVVIERQKSGPALIKYVLESHYDSRKGYPVATRATIGHQCVDSSTEMHPTSQYAVIFAAKWEELTKMRQKPATLRIGMFSAFQAVNSRCGIKDTLDMTYGVDLSSKIMDFSMYSIIFHSNNASTFTSKMRGELTYAKYPYSDSTYSRLFEKGMRRNDELLFRKNWALYCRDNEGVEGVWLCVDGSNEDCSSIGVEFAEKGHPKSGKNVNIVSYTYAVTVDGLPVTYDVYRGGLVDAKAMKKILDFLAECGIKVLGVILDRGYCDTQAIRYLLKRNLDYVIMIKGNPDGFVSIVEEYGNKIKARVDYFIPGTNLFGVQRPIQLFKSFKHEDYVTLFFDNLNGAQRIDTFLTNFNTEWARLNAALMEGKDVSVAEGFRDVLKISGDKKKKVEIINAGFQARIDEKGLYGIVTSKPMPPDEVHFLYNSRVTSEITYRIVKTELGFGSVNVHYTQGVRARYMVAFISTIVRYFIEQAAKSQGKDVNQMVSELEKLEATKVNDTYTFSYEENDRIKGFFRALGTDPDKLLEESVSYENDRLAGRVPTPRHRKTGPTKGVPRKEKGPDGNPIPKKGGVEKGTKRSDVNKDGRPRKKPGVPVGTKRGEFKKDGTPRKKPGPKPKAS